MVLNGKVAPCHLFLLRYFSLVRQFHGAHNQTYRLSGRAHYGNICGTVTPLIFSVVVVVYQDLSLITYIFFLVHFLLKKRQS